MSQGLILGPLLFLVFVDDIHENIQSDEKLFADDTTLLYSDHDASTTCKVLNEDLQQINICCEKWYLKFNSTKSVVLTLDSVIKHQTNRPTALKSDNVDLREVGCYKYLGLIFTNNLSWHQHIDSICVETGKLITMLLKLSEATPKNVLLTLYWSFIRSTLVYGNLLFTIIARSRIEIT